MAMEVKEERKIRSVAQAILNKMTEKLLNPEKNHSEQVKESKTIIVSANPTWLGVWQGRTKGVGGEAREVQGVLVHLTGLGFYSL